MRRITRTITEAAVCAAVGSAFALGCYAATTPDSKPAEFGTSAAAPSTWRSLTTEEIDVLAEGDDWDHPWESCEIDAGNRIWCGADGTWHEYPVPEPDGSVTDLHAHDDMLDLEVCAKGTEMPCRQDMPETYVVGGDGTRHEGCTIVLLTDEDSEMVCRDDTVWAS